MKMVFLPGRDNEKFWNLLETLKKNAEVIKSDWNGDCYRIIYKLDGKTYIYKEDMELGIPYTIDIEEEAE